ncbi:MAG: indole-3-glycerol-phosphate synthase [Pseudomonadota bacterium]
MSDFLEQMAVSSAARSQPATFEPVSTSVVPLRLQRFDIIAEIKSRSPSLGALARKDFNRVEQARCYASAGACAISVLTEPTRFDGSLEHLEEVVAAVPDVPVMRKDFLVHTWQVHEARAAGASGVLLIAAILDDRAMNAMLDAAAEAELFVLLEAFDANDLMRINAAMDSAAVRTLQHEQKFLVGINSRNLRTLDIDANRFTRLAPSLPAATPCVAESGLSHDDDIAAAADAGYSLALIGGALMQSDNPEQRLKSLLAVGRQQVAA